MAGGSGVEDDSGYVHGSGSSAGRLHQELVLIECQ